MAVKSERPVALITGGTSGIGLATARLLHARGHAVLVTGRDPVTLEHARRSLPEDLLVMRADVRSNEDADRVATELRDRFARVDLAFFNAGVGRMIPLEALDEAAYDECFNVNVKGQLFLLQRILPLLDRGSSVVFNAAVGAHRGLPDWSVYSASKAALLAMARSLAVELAPRGIRVNAVTPGPIDTPAIEKMGLSAAVLAGFREHVANRAPLGRFGTADEVAEAVGFLGSKAAGYITGAELHVDGGFSIVAP